MAYSHPYYLPVCLSEYFAHVAEVREALRNIQSDRVLKTCLRNISIRQGRIYWRQFCSQQRIVSFCSLYSCDISHRRFTDTLTVPFRSGAFWRYKGQLKMSIYSFFGNSELLVFISGTNTALHEFLLARNPKNQHSGTLESYLIKPIQVKNDIRLLLFFCSLFCCVQLGLQFRVWLFPRTASFHVGV